MNIDHSFKSNFPIEATESTGLYDTHSPVRNLCFILSSGQKVFFNYAYLVSVDWSAGDKTDTLKVYFTSHTIVLKGYNLGLLFAQLMEHAPRIIAVIEPRYITDDDLRGAVVCDITIQ